MGIPKQVIEAEEQADNELEQANETHATEQTPAEQPIEQEQTPKAEEPSETPPVGDAGILSNVGKPAQDDGFLMREKSAQGRLHALQGQRKADLEEWKRKEESLKSKIAELESTLEELKNRTEQPKDDIAEIRTELGNEYSDEDVERFAKVIDARVERKVRGLRERLDASDADKLEQAKAEAQSRVDGFVAQLEKDFPGFKKLDATNDARWIKFLGTSLGGVMEGTTYGDVAKSALEQLDYRKFSSVVREFAKVNGIVFSPNGTPESAADMAGMRPRQVYATQTSGNTPKIVSAQEIEQFRRAAFANKAERVYGMTRDQVSERLRFYEDAEAEGRVM